MRNKVAKWNRWYKRMLWDESGWNTVAEFISRGTKKDYLLLFTNRRLDSGILKRITVILLFDRSFIWLNHSRAIDLCCESEDTFRNWCVYVLKLNSSVRLAHIKDLSVGFTHCHSPSVDLSQVKPSDFNKDRFNYTECIFITQNVKKNVAKM